MLDELQKSILSVEVNPQFANRGRFPVVAVSTGTGDEDESEAGSSVSIGGTGFGSLFNIFGGFDTKDLKNKTTVKTEVSTGEELSQGYNHLILTVQTTQSECMFIQITLSE